MKAKNATLWVLRATTASIKYEKKIHEHILDDYNIEIRPEPEHGKPVDVHFDVRINKLVKLDVREQTFTITAFTMFKWNDPQLTWNASKFDDIQQITMSADLIWTPDIVLYNTADEVSNSHTDYYKTKAFIQANGDIIWTSPVTWRASCSFDVTWFPVDKQRCRLTFGSWTYTSKQLLLEEWGAHGRESQHGHFSIENGEWNINEITIIPEFIKFPCCPDSYSTLSKEFVLTRRSLYYFLYILLPLISLAFLFLMVFFIPHDSGERMGFGVTILLSITVYLLVISEALPEKSDDKSMLGICFITEFYMLCAALVLSLLTMNLFRRTSQPPKMLVDFYDFFHTKTKLSGQQRGIDKFPLESDGYLHCNVDDSSVEDMALTKRKRKLDTTYGDRSIRTYSEQWQRIAFFLDRVFFFTVLILICIIPVFITSALSRSGLG
ncbi:neuronal acetylcholine receptor subunit alpha-9-like [Clytia hemisphaerica]|uniref:neuronal acetylcholine receptor subunit alpha-9-like n=1 Tax=Clytia hemisphaerica TaxID=252671 RepID=UPI0034D415F0